MTFRTVPQLIAIVASLTGLSLAAEQTPTAAPLKTLNVLFVGNSYTARHNLAQLVKSMVEAGNPESRLNVNSVIYGGRTLSDHWRLGTQNIVNLANLTEAEQQATVRRLGDFVKQNADDKYAMAALKRHRELARSLEEQRAKWDIVVLQSYRDDLEGDQSLYVQYAPKFAALIKAQGARVVLYETTPTTQNAEPLTAPPDRAPVMEKARVIARLANKIDATVVPMSVVALRCQTERPDLTLRFINDAHLNQTLAFATACTFYGALLDRSPEGLTISEVTDIRFLNSEHRDLDRDGKPIKRVFSDKDRTDLQRVAWEGLKQFQDIAASVGTD